MLYTNGWGGGVGMMMDTLMKLRLVEAVNMLNIMIRPRWWWIRWWSWYLLKFIICWRSWYIQDDDGYVDEVDTCWRCLYEVDTCGCEDKKCGNVISPMVLQWIMTFLSKSQNNKKTWYHNSYGKNGTSILIHSRKWLKVTFSARTNSEFVRATSDSFNDPANWFEAIKHCKNRCKLNILKIHFNKI